MTETCSQLLKELPEGIILELLSTIQASGDTSSLPPLLHCLLTDPLPPRGLASAMSIAAAIFDLLWLVDDGEAVAACKLALDRCERIRTGLTARAFELRLHISADREDISESLVKQIPLAMILDIIDASGPRPSLEALFATLDKDISALARCLGRDLARYAFWRIKYLSQTAPGHLKDFVINVYDKIVALLPLAVDTDHLQEALYSAAKTALKVPRGCPAELYAITHHSCEGSVTNLSVPWS